MYRRINKPHIYKNEGRWGWDVEEELYDKLIHEDIPGLHSMRGFCVYLQMDDDLKKRQFYTEKSKLMRIR